jgi:hypothetical protein
MIANVKDLVKGGRAGWKIENEGFNTLKNHGHHLEHNFGHGKRNLSEAFFVLNLLAFFVHQILELTDGLYRSGRAGFSSRTVFWSAIRATFRLLLFDSWDRVFQRMNSPPRPAFQGLTKNCKHPRAVGKESAHIDSVYSWLKVFAPQSSRPLFIIHRELLYNRPL